MLHEYISYLLLNPACHASRAEITSPLCYAILIYLPQSSFCTSNAKIYEDNII